MVLQCPRRRSLALGAGLSLTSAALFAAFFGGCSGSSSSSAPSSSFGHNAPDGASPLPGGGDGVFSSAAGSDGGAGPAGACRPDPGNFEIPNNQCDDDNDGHVDNVSACDQALDVAGDAPAFAKAIGLCQTANGPTDSKWGVISAAYTQGYGVTDAPNDAQHGILPKFGDVLRPREGQSLGVISSGYGLEFDDPVDQVIFKSTFEMQLGDSVAPGGYPKPAAGCPTTDKGVHDMIVVQLAIKVPMNAKGFTFDFNFHSSEWPDYVCSEFNDAFVAFLTSSAFNSGTPDNVSFDVNHNPVSVNNGFFDRCTPGTATGCESMPPGQQISLCPGGAAELAGTGFGTPLHQYCGSTATPGGATGWLSSSGPATPGEVMTLQFMIWDTGDHRLDSSVLLDNFRWSPAAVTAPVTVRPPPR